MKFSEYLKYCLDNKIDISKWKSSELHEKIINNKPLTESEVCAKLFFEEIGRAIWIQTENKRQFEENKQQKS